jgi:hypothetical protein
MLLPAGGKKFGWLENCLLRKFLLRDLVDSVGFCRNEVCGELREAVEENGIGGGMPCLCK